MHRHQAIVPFLLYDTTTKSRGLQLHITERRHFTTTTPFRVRAMCQYIALIARVVASRRFRLCNFWLPQLQLVLVFGKLWCSKAAYVSQWTSPQNEFFSSVLSGAVCCSHYFMSWIFHFLIYWWVYFVLTNPSILAQPENNAVDRQIFMILVITNDKGCIQSVLLNPAW